MSQSKTSYYGKKITITLFAITILLSLLDVSIIDIKTSTLKFVSAQSNTSDTTKSTLSDADTTSDTTKSTLGGATNATAAPETTKTLGGATNATTKSILSEATNATSTPSSCAKLPISGISAIGSETSNPASNAFDKNLNTRWTYNGIGSWIRADLGAQKTICSLDIAWYLGNQRQNNFVISVSNDGTTFTNVFSGKSSGKTLSPEKYDFADVNARYVKITVNGNTQN